MSDNRIIEGLRLVVAQRAEQARRVMQRGVTGLPDYGKENDKLAELLEGYANGVLAAVAEYRAAAAELLMHEVVEESRITAREPRPQPKAAAKRAKKKSNRAPALQETR